MDRDDAMDETCVTWQIRGKNYWVIFLKKHSFLLFTFQGFKIAVKNYFKCNGILTVGSLDDLNFSVRSSSLSTASRGEPGT